MSVNKIASRYAQSLLDLAIEQGNLSTILEDIKGFQQATENRDLYLLLKSPIVNSEKKLSILKAIFEGKVDKLTMLFINLTVSKGREKYLPEISQAFIDKYQVYSKITSVIITTAAPMEAGELAKITEKLSASDITMENLNIETKVDPSIIGGFVMEIGDKLYDASVAHKLEELKKQFSGNDYAAQI